MPGMYSQDVYNSLVKHQNDTPLNYADAISRKNFQERRAIQAQATILNPAQVQNTCYSQFTLCVANAIIAEVG